MKIRHLVFLAVWPLAAVAAESELEFAGVIVSSGKTLVSVRDPATGTATWVEVGQRYKGFTISGYDSKESKLVLIKNGVTTTLPLTEDSKVKSAPLPKPAPMDATTQLATLKAERERLSQRYRDQHPMMLDNEKKIADLERQIRDGSAAK